MKRRETRPLTSNIAALAGVLAFIGLLSAPQEAQAGRKGFALGVHAGAGFTNTTGLSTAAQSRLGGALQIDLGWGITDQLVVHFSSKELWFTFAGELTLAEVAGFGATYHLDPDPGMYVQAIVASWSVHAQPTGPIATELGPGVWVNLGYEFMPHWAVQIGGGWGSGDTLTSMQSQLTVGYLL